MDDSNGNSTIKTAFVSRTILSDLLSRHYGLRLITHTELSGYDDKNIRVQVEDEGTNVNLEEVCRHGYVLKITNSLDSQNTELLEAQHEIMGWVSRHGVTTPQPVPSLTGHLYQLVELPAVGGCTSEHNDHLVHLYTFIPGVTLTSVPLTEGLCFKVGRLAGRVDKILEDLKQKVMMKHHWRWHMDQIPHLMKSLEHIQEEADRKLLAEIFRDFRSRVLDKIHTFPSGTLHTDVNANNVLVSKTDSDVWDDGYDVAAILDYGDCSYAPYIFEIGIAMAHLSILSDNIMKSPIEILSGFVLSGFLSQKPLSDPEVEALKVTMCARAAQVIAFTMDPTSSITNTGPVKYVSRLRHVWNISDTELMAEWCRIQRICLDKFNPT